MGMQNSFVAERRQASMSMDEVNVLSNEDRPEVGQESEEVG